MTVGIIGFGRFGQFWAHQLRNDYQVLVSDSDSHLSEVAANQQLQFLPLPELCAASDALFICVPINQIEPVVRKLKPYVRPGMAVLDVCSVKEHPARIMKEELSADGVDLIATHPMFGPDSGAAGLHRLRLVMWPVSEAGAAYKHWRSYFKKQGLQVEELSPGDHDRLAAYSQGVTHYIGRVLGRLELAPTLIDTKGFEMLWSVIEQTCNDSEELFYDLQNYNQYTAGMRRKLDEALRSVYSKLIETRPSNAAIMKIGIAGGQGSLPEQACREFCNAAADAYEIEYLMTTEKLLQALQDGRIDRGVFALYNSRGGIVTEMVEALSKFPCEILSTTEIAAEDEPGDCGESNRTTFAWASRRAYE